MEWDGTGRRRERLAMAEDIKILGENVAVLTERLTNFMDITVEYRKIRDEQAQESRNNIAEIKNNCIQHLYNNKRFKEHLEEHKLFKNTWGSRGFALFLLIINIAWAAFVLLIKR